MAKQKEKEKEPPSNEAMEEEITSVPEQEEEKAEKKDPKDEKIASLSEKVGEM